MKISAVIMSVFLISIISSSVFASDLESKGATKASGDIIVSVGIVPDLIDSAEKGPFIDVLKLIDEEYKGGKFIINAYPYLRAQENIINKKADLNMPAMRRASEKFNKQNVRFSTTSFGNVTFVLYTHFEKNITYEDLVAKSKVTPFPYKVLASDSFWDFPGQQHAPVENGLQMVNLGRADAFVWAQEEADLAIRRLKLKNIKRQFIGEFEDVFFIQKGPSGDRVDQILTESINSLKASGKLQKLYETIHRKYEPWQPYIEIKDK